ncbi:hypothetical protein TcG_11665 [Trypanosoma cruzi]|nr:hypothetical protein TcG_11665 [Trypanosoma cruzi]
MISLWRSIVHQLAYSHAHREQSALPLKIGFRHLIPPRPETSQSSTQIPVSTDSLSATEALRAAPLAVRYCVAEETWIMLLSLVKRVHPAHLILPHRTAVPHAMRPLTKKPRLHDLSSNEASQSGTWNSLPPSRCCTGRNSRRKKNSHTPHARRSSVWQWLSSWCAGRHRASNHDFAQIQCDSCPLLGIPARALQITGNPLCRCSSH